MKANELRIGNLITHYDEVIKLTGIKADGTTQYIRGCMHFGGVKITSDLYQPIPLNEEWLLKFGFSSNTSKPIQFDKGFHAVTIESDEPDNLYSYMGFDISIVRNVHQLQNLYFALTGEELTINNA